MGASELCASCANWMTVELGTEQTGCGVPDGWVLPVIGAPPPRRVDGCAWFADAGLTCWGPEGVQRCSHWTERAAGIGTA